MDGITVEGDHSRQSLIYRQHVERSIQRSLTRVEYLVGPLPSSELAQAIHILELGLMVDDLWPVARRLLLVLVPRMECDGLREEVHAVVAAALPRCCAVGDTQAEAELRWHHGVIYQLQAQYAEAQQQLEASAALYAALQASQDQARALDRLAHAAYCQRRLIEAERLVADAGRLLDSRDPECAYRLNVKGEIAMARRQWHLARVCFSQALCLLHRTDDQRMTAWACVNIGLAHAQLEQYSEATVWYRRSIDLFRRIGDPVHCAVARMNLGIVFAMSNQPDLALQHYALAEPVFAVAADVRRRAMVFNNIGYAQGLQQRWADAEVAYRMAVKLHQQSGNALGEVNSMDNLAASLEAQNRRDEAATVLQAALEELGELEPDAEWRGMYEMVKTHMQNLM